MSNDRVDADLEGLPELLKELTQMGANVKKSVKGATKAGAVVILKRARSNAKAISKGHSRKIHVSLRVRMRDGYAVGSIFPGKGHAELRPIELGTKAGWRWARKKKPFTFVSGNRLLRTRLIKHPGTAAKPWLRPAFDATQEAAARAVGESLRETIEQAKIAADGGDE
jgi:HK97 gp10 family phage protein